MQIDLSTLSRKQLEKHLMDVKRALKNAEARDKREAKKAAAKAAAEFGYSLSELSEEDVAKPKAKKSKAKKPKVKSVAKYANPADSSQTWTGKGRQPNWFKEQIAAGASPESLEI
ncbi:DNA-binding protein, H-NS family protein [Sulfitobacter noctilucae]|uniref:H-NS histone family protein n=1 Tax=Sulfitobacter noctilucae TaxID=1342302 RepID=UPI00046A55E2|nr:H-NS histone family protein [Sulfitobacter noctilucae]KIN60172.1 DNA-binding protein, H-NS family protein [Sulfitobacter noctilucae]